MGLTSRSTGVGIFRKAGVTPDATRTEFVVALAGNPNTGKSTVFNGLTRLRQHTGNWPGKTVAVASGRYTYDGDHFLLVDLPGTYSLLTNSAEEEVARDFLLSGRPDATVVVADAGCLERNLNLALQVIEITPRAVLCVNLIDEAKKSGITVNVPSLERALGIPVVATAARSGAGLDDLKKAIAGVATGSIRPEPVPVPYSRRVLQAARLLAPAIAGLGFDERGARWLAMSLLDSSGATRDSLLQFIAGRLAPRTGTGGS